MTACRHTLATLVLTLNDIDQVNPNIRDYEVFERGCSNKKHLLDEVDLEKRARQAPRVTVLWLFALHMDDDLSRRTAATFSTRTSLIFKSAPATTATRAARPRTAGVCAIARFPIGKRTAETPLATNAVG